MNVTRAVVLLPETQAIAADAPLQSTQKHSHYPKEQHIREHNMDVTRAVALPTETQAVAADTKRKVV